MKIEKKAINSTMYMEKIIRINGGKLNETNILKLSVLIVVIIINTILAMPAYAQISKDEVKSIKPSTGDDFAKQMADYSRPGKYHQILADLIGIWTFEGRRFPLNPDSSNTKPELFGTHLWTPFADGRYFIVDMTFGDDSHKIQMPIQNGKMKDVIGKGIMIQGYDNVKQKFVQAYITNHIGSGIAFSEGSYDPATKTITFNFKEQIVPGVEDEIRQLFTIRDKDRYTIEYYHKENNAYVKDTEVVCTRVKGIRH